MSVTVSPINFAFGSSGGQALLNRGSRVFRSVVQTIGTAAITAISFDTEVFDNGDYFAIGSPTRLTIPVGLAGVYAIAANASFVANAVGAREITVRLNGATDLTSASCAALTGGIVTTLATYTLFQLAVADFLELTVFQNSGGNLDVRTVSNFSPILSIQLVGRT